MTVNRLLVLCANLFAANPVLAQYATATGSPLTTAVTVPTTTAPDCGCMFLRSSYSLICDSNGHGFYNPCYAACAGIPTSSQVPCPYNTACNCTGPFVTEPGSTVQVPLNPAQCCNRFILGHDVASCYGYCCARNPQFLLSPSRCRNGEF